MSKENVLILGLGETGRPIFEILKASSQFNVYGFDVDEAKMELAGQSADNIPGRVDVMHVCLPCKAQDEFVNVVSGYVKRFKPKLLILDSTVPPGTTVKVYDCVNGLVAHAPVYGTHQSLDYMIWEMKRWTKIVGGVNAESAESTRRHFEKAGIKTHLLTGSTETELTKLFETVYTAWMIVFFQEMHRISNNYNAKLEEIVCSIGEIHKMRLDRPVWFPGVIGGHCLIPNTELLLGAHDSEFLRLILKSNEKRKEEIKDPKVSEEVEKVKKCVTAVQEEVKKILMP